MQSEVKSFLEGSIGRRELLITLFKSGVAFSFSSALGCVYSTKNNYPKSISPPLTKNQDLLMADVHNVLFPSGLKSPGAKDINSVHYFHFVLLDQQVKEKKKNLLKNGLDWLEEESEEEYKTSFLKLHMDSKKRLINKIIEKRWGERWVSTSLKYLFEALLADPIYGGNTDEVGWKWLEHQPGYPRPSELNRYPKML